MSLGYRVLEHTADVGLVVYGNDLPQVFSNAARGMFSLLTDRRRVRAHRSFMVIVEATDLEGLLAAWLEELLFLFETEGALLREFRISRLEPTRLEAMARGEVLDPDRHAIKMGIKAVTHHQLKVEHNDGYRAQVIFDI